MYFWTRKRKCWVYTGTEDRWGIVISPVRQWRLSSGQTFSTSTPRSLRKTQITQESKACSLWQNVLSPKTYICRVLPLRRPVSKSLERYPERIKPSRKRVRTNVESFFYLHIPCWRIDRNTPTYKFPLALWWTSSTFSHILHVRWRPC
jgi:hypothetical protein